VLFNFPILNVAPNHKDCWVKKIKMTFPDFHLFVQVCVCVCAQCLLLLTIICAGSKLRDKCGTLPVTVLTLFAGKLSVFYNLFRGFYIVDNPVVRFFFILCTLSSVTALFGR